MIKWKKKRVVAVLLTLLVLLQFPADFGSVAHAARKKEIRGTISVASNISQQDMQQYLDGLNKKYPGIKIKYEYYSDYDNEVSKQLQDGSYADVLFVPGSVSSDKYADYFEELGTRAELEKKYNYLESSKIIKNKIYGLPSSAYLNGILYNKEVFDKAGITEPPKTIEDFLQALRDIKERTDAIPFYTNYAAGWPLQVWEQYSYIEMTGDPDYRENGFVNELNPYGKGTAHYQVYDLLYNIVKEGLCEDDPQKSDWDQSKVMLNEGKIGCMAIGSWAMSQVRNAGADGKSVAYMPFPNEVDGKQYMTIVTDYCYAINKNSTNKEAARCYIDYMLDESGYALDHEVLSIVKTDPFLDSYGNMDNVVCLNNHEASDENYKKWVALSANLNLRDNNDEIKRVIEAGEGKRKETFDEIADDWNKRWESGRTEDMMPDTGENVSVLSSMINNTYKVDFSGTEKSYLKGLKTLRIGYLRNLAPYEYEEKGQFQGVSRQLADQMEKAFQVKVKAQAYNNSKTLFKALREGKIDMAAGVQKSNVYSDIKYSTNYMEYMNVLVKSDTKSTKNALQGTMAQVRGEDYSDYQTNAKEIYRTKDLADSLQAVENLRADFTVADYYSVNYYIQQQGFAHLTTIPLAKNGNFCFAFYRDVDTRLISVCNKVIYSIPDENMQMMLNDCLQVKQQKITVKRFIEANTFSCLLALCIIFVIVVVIVMLIMRDRNRLAKTDALTGLYNRYGLSEEMNRIYDRKELPLLFAIMDIDNFKSVNDTLGHAGGDEALKLLADTMRLVFGTHVLMARFGGDEFVLCIQNRDQEGVQAQLDKLVRSMCQTFTYGGGSVPLSISLGAVYMTEKVPYEKLFKEADSVLYEVKTRGKNSFEIRKI